MNYTYEIEDFRPEDGYLFVRYSTEGKPDTYLNLNPEDWTEEGLRKLITGQIDRVKYKWRTINLDSPDQIVGAQQVVETEPEPEEEVVLSEEELAEQELAALVSDIAQDRWLKEATGAIWNDGTDTYIFDSSTESQNRFASAVAAINSGNRVDGGVWKCGLVDEMGDLTLAFRPMLNSELMEVGSIVHSHVQKCFEVEAVCMAKISSGDLDVDYETEFLNHV
jgi:hypothetical protein